MAPKKKEVQKFSLNEFMTNDNYGSWADEVEDVVGTQALPAPERRGGMTSYGGGDRENRYTGYSSIRDNLPQTLPTRPPFTAHLGNLSYDATDETVTEFFEGCNLLNVRIIEDREQQRPKGFAYAEFGDVEGLKTALTLDGRSFQGRNIRIKVADPPKERFGATGGSDHNRDFSDWSRKGPLPDLPGSRPERRGGDFGDRRPPREPQADDGKVRDFGNWERRGPLSPLPQAERPPPSRDGSRAPRMDRSESHRSPGNRHESPAWGPGEGRQDSRPPRREFVERPERPERVPTAAEKDFNWRNNMKAEPVANSRVQSRDGSEAPPSPALSSVALAPGGRPKLNLAKRTVSDSNDLLSPSSTGDAKASPFGAARPIDTAQREREIAEKREQAIQAKKEADEKAKEERRLAKDAAEKAAAEAEAAQKEADEKAAAAAAETATADETTAAPGTEPVSNGNTAEQKVPSRPKEHREPRERSENSKQNAQSRANESINWRSASSDQRRGSAQGGAVPSGPRRGGPPRGPRNDSGRGPRTNGNGPPATQPAQSPSAEQSPSTPVDADGWTTVNKARRGPGNRA